MNTQKTLTINGKRYTGKQIARMLDPLQMTVGEDYMITLNGKRYYANYRQFQDPPYAPVCRADVADAIALMPDNGTYSWSIWLTL